MSKRYARVNKKYKNCYYTSKHIKRAKMWIAFVGLVIVVSAVLPFIWK